jgi:hypothetical protein
MAIVQAFRTVSSWLVLQPFEARWSSHFLDNTQVEKGEAAVLGTALLRAGEVLGPDTRAHPQQALSCLPGRPKGTAEI